MADNETMMSMIEDPEDAPVQDTEIRCARCAAPNARRASRFIGARSCPPRTHGGHSPDNESPRLFRHERQGVIRIRLGHVNRELAGQ